jgi:hypothetical protein
MWCRWYKPGDAPVDREASVKQIRGPEPVGEECEYRCGCFYPAAEGVHEVSVEQIRGPGGYV